MHLTSQPTANVTIAATADTAQLACTTTLTFTTGNWNHDQDVTCTANDDKVAESTTVVPISFAAASADANYQGVHVDTVYATVEDNDIGDKVTVVGGANAIQQAISLSKLNFPTDGTASGVVVARDDLAVDVFTGTSYNVASNSPVLLVKTKALPREVLDEVDRVLGPNKGKPVVLAGGTAAVSSAVEDALKLHGYTNVKRFNGATRRATALLFAQGLDAFNEKPATKLVVADDRSLVDALSMAPVASQFEDHVADPILISTRGADAVDPAIVDYLHAHGTITDVELVGGPQALTTGFESNLKQQFPQLTVTRTAGADRFATNLAVLEAHFTQPRTLAVARGDTAGIPGSTTVSASVTPPTLYTALLASGFVSRLQGPVVLVRKTSIPSGTRQYLAQHHETIDVVYVVAQPGGISATVRSDLTALTH
ncbi:MAG: cell wall-binding repeat-containing protein [Candidatus Andersenbacteria bacterium]